MYHTMGASNVEPPITLAVDSQTFSVVGRTGSTWIFDLSTGNLTSWVRPGRPHHNILTQPLVFDLYRALTDNDRGGRFGGDWRGRRLHQIKTHLIQISWRLQDGVAEVVVIGRVAPPVLNWSVHTETTFRLNGENVSIRVKARPQGLLLPGTFARFGLAAALADVERVRWFGRGPGESYRDKKMSQAFGTWDRTVDDLFVDYEFPQDAGNRTDVRWVEFMGLRAKDTGDRRAAAGAGSGEGLERVLRARFGDADGASFQALHYATKDLDECTHPYELHKRKREDTVVHLDWMHHGLGTGSCGPATLPQYELRTDREYNVHIVLD